MKRLLVLVAVLALAAPASSVVFETTNQGNLKFSNLGGSEASSSGTGLAIVNGSGGGGHLNTLNALFNPDIKLNTVIAVTDPIVTAGGIVEVRLTDVIGRPDLQGGVMAPISGAAQNTALGLTQNTVPSTGSVRICLFFTGCNSGSLDLALGSATANGAFTKGAGIGGVLTIGGEGAIRISIVGGPWTLKTATVSNRTDNGGITIFSRKGFVHGPASLTSSTAATSGVVQLVVASQTTTSGVPGNGDKSGNITFARTHFVPEPGLLLLLGTGAVGMVLLGRSRMKK